jgi:anti-sigma factor RsiW
MIRCKDAELLVQDYLDGYLLSSQGEVLEDHLRSCPSCRMLLDEMRHLDDDLLDMPQIEDPGNLSGRILGSIPRQKEYPRRRAPLQFFNRYSGGALAALMLMAVGFLFGVRGGMHPDTARQVEIVFFAPMAGSVAVVGDFNGWDRERHIMERRGDDGIWRLRLRLPPGMYEYSFFVDGQDWSKDPRAEGFLADGFGGKNSILFVDG